MATPPDDRGTRAREASAPRDGDAGSPDGDEVGAPPRPGTHWAGYRIVRVLARGASGTLFAAIDPRQGQPRALKVLDPPTGWADGDAAALRERFVQQATALRQLSHPAIVGVHDAGQVGERV